MTLLCFTDLDGTLLNHDDYSYEAAIPVIHELQHQGIPVIPNTSKTRAEVTELRQALELKDPFVVENGSGIFLEPGDDRFGLEAYAAALDEVDGPTNRLLRLQLGVDYGKARGQLRMLGEAIAEPLRGFGDMTPEEVQQLTGLSLAEVEQACDREFSEPFLKPYADLEELEALAAERRYQILVGNRFCHLLGAQAGKGNAVQLLKQAWLTAHPGDEVVTLGLGDSPNDLSMLEAVDIAVVVPGVNGPHPQLAEQGWKVAPEMGCVGWAKAVVAVALEMGIEIGRS